METLRLNFPPHSAPKNEKLRLACQVRVVKACEVRKYDKFWGEGDVLVASEETDRRTEMSLPFGELEFLFDPEAPKKE
jgi:hypothetical protein